MRSFPTLFLVLLFVLGSCSLAWEPTPDPTQGFKAVPVLEETKEVNGTVTTNLALDKADGLGLSLVESEENELPKTVEERVASLNPSITVVSPKWGDLLTGTEEVEVEVQGAAQLRQVFLLNGERIAGGRGMFSLPDLPSQHPFSLLQAFLLEEDNTIVSAWNVALLHQEEQELPISIETPLLTVLEPQQGQRYTSHIPVAVYLSQNIVGPGGAALALDINGERTYVYHLQPFLLELPKGQHEVRISVVDAEKNELLRPLYNDIIELFVD